MTVPLSALQSVRDRTLFTNKGVIVKQPLPLLTGSNLMVIGPNLVQIPTASFDLTFIGKTITISGSPHGRNDGTFPIAAVPNSTTLALGNATLDASDPQVTLAAVVALANNIKAEFNAHVVNGGTGAPPYVHGTIDPADVVLAQNSVDLSSVIILLNELLPKFLNHIGLTGGVPPVHLNPDSQDVVLLPPASNLASAFYLANALRQAYELHRDSGVYHYERDTVDRVTVPSAQVAFQSGVNIGPFNWVLSDPRIGEVADSPADVQVFVNGIETSVDAVFGLLGAVVLTNTPQPTDTVTINYDFLGNPPTQFQRLNSPEFVLNESGNRGFMGVPGYTYRAKATLVDPTNALPTIKSPYQPLRTGWKYKMLQRSYSAVLNDPNTLLLNVPTNRVFFPVLNAEVFEVVIRYDPTALPDQATDPWTLEGQGTMSLAPGGTGLTIVDSNPSPGPGIEPPFYTHPIDLTFDSTVSAAFRVSVSQTVPDGTFTGVGFGLADGQKVALVGLLLTDANNLSSAIAMVNDLSAAFDAHLILTGVHRPNDTIDTVDIVNATDLTSLIILANRLKVLMNQHMSYGGGHIHVLADSADQITAPDSTDLPSALALVNQLRDNLNTHLTAPGIHYNNDTVNSVGLVQQIGFLTNSGFPEFEDSWVSGAVNWSIDATYRIFRDSEGNVSLYTSGAVVPTASVTHAQLPATSDVDIRLNPMSQVFFGAVWRRSTSTSKWAFIRVDVTPIDEDQIGDNKAVDYEPTVLPELDPTAPWITIGQSGFERLSLNKLVLDSTASAPLDDIAALGMTTGAYRGFLRLEPILTRVAASTVEFTASLGFYTFSLDNKGAGVFIDDDIFSTWLLFLQDTPSAATVTGTSTQPFGIATNDTAIIGIGSAEPITVTFTSPATTTAQVSTVINAAVGFALAADNGSGAIVLTDQTLGANSQLRLLGGNALEKLGLALGTYFGRDSNPEPKVSWFGATFPDQDTPDWVASGSQASEMLGRTMRITDSSTSDFLVYTLNNTLYTSPVFNPAVDWKVDFRLAVVSFTPGNPIVSGTNLQFAGVLVNVDEGTSGKNVELQYAVDQFGGTYINVLSYNSTTGFLDQQAAFPFAWNDGQIHSVDLFTNKTAGICIVLGDNISLGNFSYNSLHPGVVGPAMTFGSGGTAVGNGDPSTAMSVVDWRSVCGFRDLKVADPTAASRRFIGIYSGGDPSLLASYYISQVDWTQSHTYRVVRDPSGNVSVFLDGGNIPVISINYDAIKLPGVAASFLQPITGNRECIAFGCFDPEEIARVIWGPIKYSIGKLTLTNRLIPPHQTLNQANAVVSPEHLHTQLPHEHAGFTVYSGGTPSDDFLSNPALAAFTNLGEGTPPVPMTQDLQSRGGLSKTATLQEAVPALQFVDESGFLSDLEDDTTNATSSDTPITELISIVFTQVIPTFNNHLISPGVHQTNDPGDTVPIPGMFNLPNAISAMNQVRTNYEAHRVAAGVHVIADTLFAITAPPATDAPSLATLVQNFQQVFVEHVERTWPHNVIDIINLEPLTASDLPTLITLSNDLQAFYNAHLSEVGVHVRPDTVDISTAPPCFDLPSALALLPDIETQFNRHIVNVDRPNAPGVHKGIDRFNSDSDSPPVDLPTGITFANNLANHYNQHILVQDSHLIVDLEGYNLGTAFVVQPFLAGTLVVLNNLLAAFNKHVVQYRVHLSNDQFDAVLLPPAVDLPTGIALANALKANFNAHRVAVVNDSDAPAHVMNDTVNVVTAPDAVDEGTMAVLADAINLAYNLHLTQPGVHGNSIFIHIDPPSGVLYENLKFFPITTGEAGLVAPFSDDETLHMGGLKYQTDHTLSYEGGSFPEQVNLVGANVQPFSIEAGDNLSIAIDTNPPIIVQFQATDTTIGAVVSRINGTPGIPANFASNNGDGRLRLTSPTIGPPSSIFVGGPASIKLGLDVAQFTPFVLAADNPGAVTLQLLSVGVTDFLRYSTTGTGTKTVYISPSGLPDATSLDFDVTFSVRINAAVPDPITGDTNIYIGISGMAGPGFTAAIGFDTVNSVNFIKIQDLNANKCLFRRAFNWADGNFHTYKLIRTAATNSFSIAVLS
jgi:hypothetical protein